MEGYDDLGPPTHPNELALDAEIGGGRELDDGGDMDLMDLGGPVDMGGPDLDAPELNTDLEDLGQASLSFRCVWTELCAVRGCKLYYLFAAQNSSLSSSLRMMYAKNIYILILIINSCEIGITSFPWFSLRGLWAWEWSWVAPWDHDVSVGTAAAAAAGSRTLSRG